MGGVFLPPVNGLGLLLIVAAVAVWVVTLIRGS